MVSYLRETSTTSDTSLKTWYRTLSLANQAWWDGRVSESARLLDEIPSGERSWDWGYLRRRCHSTLAGVDTPGTDIRAAFLDDGRCCVAASSDGAVRLLDVSGIHEARDLSSAEPGQPVVAEQGERVAFVQRSGQVAVYETRTGALVRSVPGPKGPAVRAALSGNGRRLAAADSDHLQLWDLETGKSAAAAIPAGLSIRGVAISRDGSKAAIAGLRTVDPEAYRRLKLPVPGRLVILVFDTAMGSTFSTIESEGDEATWGPVALSPHGEQVAAPGKVPTTASIWKTTRTPDFLPITSPLLALIGHSDAVIAIAFSPDGSRLASAAADRIVRVWDLATGREVAALRGHEPPIDTLLFSHRSDRLVSAGRSAVRIWDATTGSESETALVPGLTAAAAFPLADGSVLLAETGGPLRSYDLDSRRVLRTLANRPADSPPPAVTPDGRWLADNPQPGTIQLDDLAADQVQRTFYLGGEPAHSLAISPDGRRIAAAAKSAVVIWNAETGAVIGRWEKPPRSLSLAMAFSSDARRLAQSLTREGPVALRQAEDVLKIWDVDGQQEILSVPTSGPPRAIAWSPAGDRLLTVSGDGRAIDVREAATGRQMFTLFGHRHPIVGIGFDQTRRLISVGRDDAGLEFKKWNPQ